MINMPNCKTEQFEQNITYKGFEGHFYRINGWHTMQYYVIHVIHPTDAIFAPGALQDLRNVMMNCIDDIGATAVAPWLGENWVFPPSQLMHLNVKSPVRAINVDGVRKIGINEANIEHIKGLKEGETVKP